MICPVFFLLLIVIHAISENDQGRGSKHNFARLFDTLVKTPNRSRLQKLDPPGWSPEIDTLEDRPLNWAQNPSVDSSIIPLEEKLETPFFLNFGRQSTGCTCQAALANNVGTCETTCFTTETQCGQICTRTTVFSALSEFGFERKRYEFSRFDEKACEKLEIDCLMSSLLSTASSSYAVAGTASVAANIALSAGIAAGIAALVLAAKGKDTQSEGDHYEEIEDPYQTEEQYVQSYARRLVKEIPDVSDGAVIEEERSKQSLSEEANVVEGSILSLGKDLDVPQFLRVGRQAGCQCYPLGLVPGCATECLSYSQLCDGKVCTVTTTVITYSFNANFRSYRVTDSKDCNAAANLCTVSSVMSSLISVANARSNAIALNAGIAGALSAGLAGGNIAAVANANSQQTNNNVDNQQISDNSNNQAPQPGNQTPTNDLTLPVPGSDFPDDGNAGPNSIQFDDGNSYPLLSRGPCNGTNFWVTVNPVTLKGGCTPKLCEDRRVFVGRTGLCHDINDPLECQGGRRLYYTAYGDPICDCPIGKYPFPNPKDNCVALFTRGPCPAGRVVTISQGGRLFCTPDECPANNGENDSQQQLVPNDKGECFALGSAGPCPASQLLGYDVFERKLQCVNITDPFSPYFSPSSQESGLIDRVLLDALMSYQFHPEDNDLYFGLIRQAKRGKIQRQDANTAGILQLPSSLPDPLLQPCRTGARQGKNFKCTNPLISDSSETGQTLPPVNPNFSCPDNTFLQATGQCIDDSRATSCGPSFRFNEATGQCRSVF